MNKILNQHDVSLILEDLKFDDYNLKVLATRISSNLHWCDDLANDYTTYIKKCIKNDLDFHDFSTWFKKYSARSGY